MKKLLLTLSILVPSFLYAGGITIGFLTGWNPDILHFNTAIATTQTQFQNCINGSNTTCSASDRSSKLITTSSQASGIPLGLNVRYIEKYFILMLGVNYQFTVGGKNVMEVTYSDGKKQTVTEDYDMRILEIPFTAAFNLRHDAYTRLYAGIGPTLFYGSAFITHDNGRTGTDSSGNEVKLFPDEDLFQGWALGAHAIFGSEVSLSSEFSLSFEVWFNYGLLGAVQDKAITEAGTKNIQAQENPKNPEILGIYTFSQDAKFIPFDPKMPNGLDFTGIQLLISFNYFIGTL
ncbi:MAG: hypothetical protein D6767_05470 [Candidatus Hydrogenedentota bacterium]|nr:MAG: hypothetical protein D6767_05470 [Candidatus Hydrogenedentota bacterium]